MLIKYVDRVGGALDAARDTDVVGLLVDFADGTAVQYQVNRDQQGADGRPLMAVELVSPRRLRRSDRARLAEIGWERPRGRAMPCWWHLVGDRAEARLVAGRILLALQDVLAISAGEIFDLGEPDASAASGSQTATPPDAERLRSVATRWNDAASSYGMPGCDPEPDEFEGTNYCPLFEFVRGTNIGPDLVADGERVLLRFAVNNEGAPTTEAIEHALQPILPAELSLHIDDHGYVFLSWDVTSLEGHSLADAWSRGQRAAFVAWAAVWPWTHSANATDHLGFNDANFNDDGSTSVAAQVMTEAAFVMSQQKRQLPWTPGDDPVGFGDDVALTHIEAIGHMAAGMSSPALIDAYGGWLASELSSWPTGMCCVQDTSNVVEGLHVDWNEQPPRWSLDYFGEEEVADEDFKSLGWAGEHGSFSLPAGTSPGVAGRIVARTCLIAGHDIEEDFWMFRNIGDADQCSSSLRAYIESGDVVYATESA